MVGGMGCSDILSVRGERLSESDMMSEKLGGMGEGMRCGDGWYG
jgi:hypothetical protein